MNEESLRDLLARVHERLSAPGELDGEARHLLETVMRDINAALDRRSSLTGATPTLPRMESLAVRFEAEHPALAQLLRQIGALLEQAGI